MSERMTNCQTNVLNGLDIVDNTFNTKLHLKVLGLTDQLIVKLLTQSITRSRLQITKTRPDTRLPKSRAGTWAEAIFEVTRPFGQER